MRLLDIENKTNDFIPLRFRWVREFCLLMDDDIKNCYISCCWVDEKCKKFNKKSQSLCRSDVYPPVFTSKLSTSTENFMLRTKWKWRCYWIYEITMLLPMGARLIQDFAYEILPNNKLVPTPDLIKLFLFISRRVFFNIYWHESEKI